MSAQTRHRILRNFRRLSPGPFHVFNQKVTKGVAEHKNNPTLAAHSDLISSYLGTSEKHDGVYHESRYGSILVITERDFLQQQLVEYLDQIASLFEMAAVLNPEILLSSGFDLAKDRRSISRSKQAPAVSDAPAAVVPGSDAT